MFKMLKGCTLFFLVLISLSSENVLKNTTEEYTSTHPNVMQHLFEKNIKMFKECVDHGLAMTVDQVNVHKLQPVLSVIGKQLNLMSEAFEELKTIKGESQDEVPNIEDFVSKLLF